MVEALLVCPFRPGAALGRTLLGRSLRWGRTGFDLDSRTSADMSRMMVGLVNPSIKTQMLMKQMNPTPVLTPCSRKLRTA